MNFRAANWPTINAALTQQLEAESPAVHIKSKEEFNHKVDEVVRIIKVVLEEQLEEKRPNPFKRRWWTGELTSLKKK